MTPAQEAKVCELMEAVNKALIAETVAMEVTRGARQEEGELRIAAHTAERELMDYLLVIAQRDRIGDTFLTGDGVRQ